MTCDNIVVVGTDTKYQIKMLMEEKGLEAFDIVKIAVDSFYRRTYKNLSEQWRNE